jgi:P27 family predicted phage terminase small subunit
VTSEKEGCITMPGPPPQPAERKRKRGNPGRRPLPDVKEVGTVVPVTASAPGHLADDGRAVYELITAQCSWIAETDRPYLVILCEKIDQRADFKRRLAASDPVLYTDKGYAYANPLVGMLSTIEKEIASMAASLGLTPSDRSRLGVAEVKAQNAFEQMMASRAKRGG